MTATLIEHGVLIPVDGKHRSIEGRALLVEDDRIAAIDTPSAIRKKHEVDNVIDARGQAALPGFVNAHTHTPLQATMWGIAYGMLCMLESIRQVRGEAAAQVEGVRTSLAHGWGGFWSACSTVIFGNEVPGGGEGHWERTHRQSDHCQVPSSALRLRDGLRLAALRPGAVRGRDVRFRRESPRP